MPVIGHSAVLSDSFVYCFSLMLFGFVTFVHKQYYVDLYQA